MASNLAARCLHCAIVGRVDEMRGHLRSCAPRRWALLQRRHEWTALNGAICLRQDECAEEPHCQWTRIVTEELMATMPDETLAMLHEWMNSLVALNDNFNQAAATPASCIHVPPRVPGVL